MSDHSDDAPSDDAPSDDAPSDDVDETSADDGSDDSLDRSTVDVTDAGAAEPKAPKWEMPDVDDVPEFEPEPPRPPASGDQHQSQREDPTMGMPNEARSPDQRQLASSDTDAYVVALELCSRLPDDVRLPESAPDLVPASVEAELEQEVQSFAAAEFDNPSPSVPVLEFVEADGDVWLKLRLGVPAASFDDLTNRVDDIERHALQRLETMF